MENHNLITNELIRKVTYGAFLSYKEHNDIRKSLHLLKIFTESLQVEGIEENIFKKIRDYFLVQINVFWLWIHVYKNDLDLFLENWEDIHKNDIIIN